MLTLQNKRGARLLWGEHANYLRHFIVENDSTWKKKQFLCFLKTTQRLKMPFIAEAHIAFHGHLLSGVPDFFDRNKILSGYDLSHYQVPHCIRVFFYFVWFVFIHHESHVPYVPIVTFWILTYHKIWILLIIFCFIWSYWIIYFLTCLEVFWSVVS